MLGLVLRKVGIGMTLHQLDFVGKMGTGVADQRLQHGSDHRIALAGFHGIVELINQIDQFLVLVIKFFHFYTVSRAPIDKCHSSISFLVVICLRKCNQPGRRPSVYPG